MYIINGNYGNPSLALIQWIYQQKLNPVTVLTVDTGWASATWRVRVEKIQQYARDCGFNVLVTQARMDFAALVKERGGFPSQKFQWCAGILKGLPLLNYLDEVDPRCEAMILMGKRQVDLPTGMLLPEFVEDSDHFGGRRVWHPLYNADDAAFYNLIKRTGFHPLQHRSLECDPCIHNTTADFQRLQSQDLLKVQQLEQVLAQPMFQLPIAAMQQQAQTKPVEAPQNVQSTFYKSCGSPFGCGE